MKKFNLVFFMAFVSSAFLGQPPAYGQNVSIYNLDGNGSLLRNGKSVSIKPDTVLQQNDRVSADIDSSMDIAFYWYMGCRLAGGAEAVLAKARESAISLQVKSGTVLVNARALPDTFTYEIETPLAVVTVKGTVQFWARIFLDENKKNAATFASRRGVLFVRLKSGSTLAIAEGNAIDVSADTFIPSARPLSEEEEKTLDKTSSVLIPILDESSS